MDRHCFFGLEYGFQTFQHFQAGLLKSHKDCIASPRILLLPDVTARVEAFLNFLVD